MANQILRGPIPNGGGNEYTVGLDTTDNFTVITPASGERIAISALEFSTPVECALTVFSGSVKAQTWYFSDKGGITREYTDNPIVLAVDQPLVVNMSAADSSSPATLRLVLRQGKRF